METPKPFEYREKKLGDTTSIVVETSAAVFYPTSTTVLLVDAIREHVTRPLKSLLDLGCGCGIVGIALKKLLPAVETVCASDLSKTAVELTKQNADSHGICIDCRCGSLFEPWAGTRFEVIADDVAGVAEPIARVSSWYPAAVPSEAGRDGTRWIVRILSQAKDYLLPGGKLFFPVVTLSDHRKILEKAKEQFRSVELLKEQWYPVAGELLARYDLVQEFAREGIVELRQRGSRLWWATRVYLATDSL